MGSAQPVTRRRRHTRLASLGRTLTWGLLAAAGALLVVAAGPRLVGWQTHTVSSASMTPALQVGDLVVVRPIHPSAARAGDIVTFRDPLDRDRLLTHRVQSVTPAGGGVAFETRGDANDAPERWVVARDGRIGRMVYRVPSVGRAAAAAHSPWGRITLLAAPSILLGGAGLRILWWRPGRPAGTAAARGWNLTAPAATTASAESVAAAGRQ